VGDRDRGRDRGRYRDKEIDNELTYARAHCTGTHARTHARTHQLTHSYARERSRTHTRTHAHTCTHTQGADYLWAPYTPAGWPHLREARARARAYRYTHTHRIFDPIMVSPCLHVLYPLLRLHAPHPCLSPCPHDSCPHDPCLDDPCLHAIMPYMIHVPSVVSSPLLRLSSSLSLPFSRPTGLSKPIPLRPFYYI
jgi:hypothetical protein